MKTLGFVVVVIFLILYSGPFIWAQKPVDTLGIVALFQSLGPEDQQKVIDYANFMQLKSQERPEDRAIREQEADQIIPTEATSRKIMEFSRYMMMVQKTTAQKIDEEAKPLTEITFDHQEFNFKKVKEGAKLTHHFQFANTGAAPLYIYDVETSCGCTVPDWPKIPIQPGETATITVNFNTLTKKGKQHKVVKVLSNTNPKITALYIKGKVL